MTGPDLPPPERPGPGSGGVLTVLGIVLLALNAALLGGFGVAFTPIFVAGVPVPMGVLFTVLILPWLVLRTGELSARAAGLPLGTWFAVVAVLAVVSPGGDVMVPLWWQSGALLIGGLGAGLWALRQVMVGTIEGYGHG